MNIKEEVQTRASSVVGKGAAASKRLGSTGAKAAGGFKSAAEKFITQLGRESKTSTQGKIGRGLIKIGGQYGKAGVAGRMASRIGASAGVGAMFGGPGGAVAAPIITETARKAFPMAKGARRIWKKMPGKARGAVGLAGLAVGAIAMFGAAVMKGGMNQSREIVMDRYMQDQAAGKQMLNQTRVGLSAGTSRMNAMGSTMGLSNSLSRTRHGGM